MGLSEGATGTTLRTPTAQPQAGADLPGAARAAARRAAGPLRAGLTREAVDKPRSPAGPKAAPPAGGREASRKPFTSRVKGKVGGLLALGHYCTKKQADCVGNPVLEDVSALSGLERAKKILIRPKCAEDEGGPHDCAFNAALKSVSFDSLREAESVELERNPLLEEAHFNALESASALKVIKSEPLRVLSFESLTTLGELYINDARALEELRMPELVHSDRIEMVFVALKDLGGLGSLKTLGLLDLNYNELRSLRGLEKLSSARSIGIVNHAELESIEALSSLESVSEDIYLFSNPRLESLHGLESLEQANGVTIAYCHALEDLEPLSSLKTVQSWLVIRGNEGLLSLQGLEKVETTKRLSIAERFAARLTLDEPPTVESNDDQATCPP